MPDEPINPDDIREALLRLFQALEELADTIGKIEKSFGGSIKLFRQFTHDYKNGPPCTFQWPVGGFIRSEKL